MRNPQDRELLCELAQEFARAEIPDVIVGPLRMGRMTALRKRTGCARHRGRRDLASFSGAHNSPKFGRRVQESVGSTPVRLDHTIRV